MIARSGNAPREATFRYKPFIYTSHCRSPFCTNMVATCSTPATNLTAPLAIGPVHLFAANLRAREARAAWSPLLFFAMAMAMGWCDRRGAVALAAGLGGRCSVHALVQAGCSRPPTLALRFRISLSLGGAAPRAASWMTRRRRRFLFSEIGFGATDGCRGERSGPA